MMQVNLFSSQDNLSPTHRSLSPSSSLKSHCMSLENELSEDLNRGDLLSVFNSKPLPTNNNEFPKDIFTITQGPERIVPRVKERRLSCSDHHKTLLNAFKELCIDKEFVDVHIQCEDGTIAAHALILGISSPFLRSLIENELSSSIDSKRGVEPIVIVLADVKVSLIQVLLEVLYTGSVVTQEGQVYALMKLLYDLAINISIGAEKTNAPSTKFDITPVTKSNNDFECQSCRPRKRSRIDTFDSTINALFDSNSNMQSSNNKSMRLSSQDGLNLWGKSGGLVVNSLTASGVEVKQEPEEKPTMSEERQYDQSELRQALKQANFSLSSNSVNNNQLSHFVSVNPGYQVKLELPPSSNVQLGNNSLVQSSPQTTVSKDSSSSDDPLAAIMNQTIFGGDGLNMYIQVSNNVSSFVNSSPKPQQPAQSKPQEKEKDAGSVTNSQFQENLEDLSCTPDDDDINTSYNCETCNRVMKGKVMLQAHRFQEHHENPEFETSSFPEDKFACRVCLKLFTRNSDVKAHILRVHCGDRRYPCTQCGKRFKESTHLRKHLYTHTGERPHFCSYCSKGFQTSSDLKRHKKTRVHQERVDQCNVERNHSNPETPTDKSMDANIDFQRWNEGDEEDLATTLNSHVSPSSPFSNLSSLQSQPSTPPFSTMNSNSSIGSPLSGIPGQRSQPNLPFTTSTSQYIQLPPRQSSGSLVFSSSLSNQTHQVHFVTDSLPKSSWQSQPSNLLLQNQTLSDNQTLNNIGLTSSHLGDTISSLQTQNLGVQNLTLPSTTLDLSDIKWGILDSAVIIKRSGSSDSPLQEEERLTIQEDL